jgi:hypothetical protein
MATRACLLTDARLVFQKAKQDPADAAKAIDCYFDGSHRLLLLATVL